MSEGLPVQEQPELQGPHSIRLPVVRRVEDDRGSHIEPPLDQSWPEAERLAWHAAVVSDEIGMPVHLWSHAGDDRADLYAIGVGGSSAAAYSYDRAWTLLSGIASGVRAERSRRADRDIPEEMVEKGALALNDGHEQHAMARWGKQVRFILAAALEGCAVVQLPEPDKVASDDDDPGKGSAYWGSSDNRPARAAVIVSRGAVDRPLLMIDRLVWEVAEARAVAEMFLAAAQYADQLTARAASGSGVGDQP